MHRLRSHAMTATASVPIAEPASSAAALALRLAQRAFAAFIDDAAQDRVDANAFHGAQLRSTARRTLSALSADDQPRLTRWLTLQFAAGVVPDNTVLTRWLARVDARLSANISTAIARTREELRAHMSAGTAA